MKLSYSLFQQKKEKMFAIENILIRNCASKTLLPLASNTYINLGNFQNITILKIKLVQVTFF